MGRERSGIWYLSFLIPQTSWNESSGIRSCMYIFERLQLAANDQCQRRKMVAEVNVVAA